MDAWHKLLIGTVVALAGALPVLWRFYERKISKLHMTHAAALAEQNEAHKTDIRALTQAALKLGLSLTTRARWHSGSSESPPSLTERAEEE